MKQLGSESRGLHQGRSALLAKAISLLSTSSLLSLARIAGALAGFVTQIVLARTLVASELGLFYSVTSLGAVVGLIAAHGYPGIASRFVSRYRERGKRELVVAFVARARADTMTYVAAATLAVLAGAALWPSLGIEVRLALAAAALSIPANASLRLNGSLAAAIRRFSLAYLPDTCIRPFLLLAGVLTLMACGVTLTASGVSWLLTAVFASLALAQYVLLERDMPDGVALASAPRLQRTWRREAKPVILVALFTNFFGDVAILLATPLLTGAETAALGLCLKLALLVGFAVQVAHQLAIPDLADAHARKDAAPLGGVLVKALAFPLAVTTGAMIVTALWGEHLLAIFGPDFVGAKWPLVILLACQLARALFGPNVGLLTVIGAQRQNAMLAVAALAVLGIGNLALVPFFGVMGASVAVALSTLFWLVASAVLLGRVSGLRTDALHLLQRAFSARLQAAGAKG